MKNHRLPKDFPELEEEYLNNGVVNSTIKRYCVDAGLTKETALLIMVKTLVKINRALLDDIITAKYNETPLFVINKDVKK